MEHAIYYITWLIGQVITIGGNMDYLRVLSALTPEGANPAEFLRIFAHSLPDKFGYFVAILSLLLAKPQKTIYRWFNQGGRAEEKTTLPMEHLHQYYDAFVEAGYPTEILDRYFAGLSKRKAETPRSFEECQKGILYLVSDLMRRGVVKEEDLQGIEQVEAAALMTMAYDMAEQIEANVMKRSAPKSKIETYKGKVKTEDIGGRSRQ